MKKRLLSAILGGRYVEYRDLLHTISVQEQCNLLYELALDTKSIAIYTTLWFMIFENEEAAYHGCATMILQEFLGEFRGSSSAALFHARRACLIDPHHAWYKRQRRLIVIDKSAIKTGKAPELSTVMDAYMVGEIAVIKVQFMKKVLCADFDAALSCLQELYIRKNNDFLTGLSCQYECLALYTLACYIILKTETVSSHFHAEQTIAHAFAWVEGAYSSALAHARRMVELEPANHRRKETVIFFNHVPDHLVDDEEATQIALEILEKDPANRAALQTLKDIDESIARARRRFAFVDGDNILN